MTLTRCYRLDAADDTAQTVSAQRDFTIAQPLAHELGEWPLSSGVMRLSEPAS